MTSDFNKTIISCVLIQFTETTTGVEWQTTTDHHCLLLLLYHTAIHTVVVERSDFNKTIILCVYPFNLQKQQQELNAKRQQIMMPPKTHLNLHHHPHQQLPAAAVPYHHAPPTQSSVGVTAGVTAAVTAAYVSRPTSVLEHQQVHRDRELEVRNF